jgi:hypothetical protein
VEEVHVRRVAVGMLLRGCGRQVVDEKSGFGDEKRGGTRLVYLRWSTFAVERVCCYQIDHTSRDKHTAGVKYENYSTTTVNKTCILKRNLRRNER